MRISITFSVPYGSSIPVNYNHILTGLIYRLAGGEAPEWAAKLHEQGFSGDGKRPYKFFTFSQLFGGPGSAKVESGRLIFTTDTLRWTFGSCLPVLSTLLMDALLSAGTVNIGGMKAKVTSVKAEQRKEFSRGTARFTSISPLVASLHDEQRGHSYLAPGDPLFWKVLAVNLSRKWRALTGTDTPGGISFEPDMAYIGRKRTSKAITVKPGEVVIGHLVPFSASGPSELLCMGYESGFGSRNSLGFGMAATTEN